jgi:hypothetical protein
MSHEKALHEAGHCSTHATSSATLQRCSSATKAANNAKTFPCDSILAYVDCERPLRELHLLPGLVRCCVCTCRAPPCAMLQRNGSSGVPEVLLWANKIYRRNPTGSGVVWKSGCGPLLIKCAVYTGIVCLPRGIFCQPYVRAIAGNSSATRRHRPQRTEEQHDSILCMHVDCVMCLYIMHLPQ